MSEPHELEEMCAAVIQRMTGFTYGRDGEHIARAVLALVRQEQEALVPGNQWERTWLHAWWLSHTAPTNKEE